MLLGVQSSYEVNTCNEPDCKRNKVYANEMMSDILVENGKTENVRWQRNKQTLCSFLTQQFLFTACVLVLYERCGGGKSANV